MKLRICWIQQRPGKDKSTATRDLTDEYLKRLAHYAQVETMEVADEAALFKRLDRRGNEAFIFMDSRGKQFTSEEFSTLIGDLQDRGAQVTFAIGGPDGWTEEALRSANMKISLGKITLPHELARVVLLEQIYRAFTILAKHPYHCGH
jgi:23S rRNA (pseudouridine1915-N3)-methyltransferase